VLGIKNAIGVSVGKCHSCALLSGGAIKCWGANNYGGLGNGNEIDSSRPVLVKHLEEAGAVVAGWEESCALVSHGIVECWGSVVGPTPTFVPTPVESLAGAKAISLNGRDCAIVTGSTVKCWGETPPSTVNLRAFESRR
jgi:hypothetical protein